MSFYDAIELKRGDFVNYYEKRCEVLSVDKRSGVIEIKEPGTKGFVSFVWPKSCRKVRNSGG